MYSTSGPRDTYKLRVANFEFKDKVQSEFSRACNDKGLMAKTKFAIRNPKFEIRNSKF
jgi:hypothetical protein